VIATDTSSLSAFLARNPGPDVDIVRAHLRAGDLVLPPVTLTEALSSPLITAEAMALLLTLPLLAETDGCWERAGGARRLLRSKGLRARLGDALIAQACVDANVPLITRDSDFRHYAAHCGLRLA
jgi:predicted nucleic acid-binding protein